VGGRAVCRGCVVRPAGPRALAVDPGRRRARIGVHGRLRDHAAAAARGRRRQRRSPAHAGHHLRGQRGVGLSSAGRTRAGHGLCLPPIHPAGRGRSRGRLVAAGRLGGLLGGCGPGRGRRRAGVRKNPARCGRGHGRRARRSGPRRGRGRRAAARAAPRARTMRRTDTAVRGPSAATPRRRSRAVHPGLVGAAGLAPASPVGLADGDRPGPGQLARRRSSPRREHPRRRRRRALAHPPAGVRHGNRRPEPERHTRRPRGR
jgi:hypothetical protein